MNKLNLNKPTLILLYGFPGSGKSFLARQLAEDIVAAHIQADRVRHELFESPRYDKQENEIIIHLMEYMAEEFLQAGVSVIFDTNAMRVSQRRNLRELARKAKAETTLIWLQVDQDSAYMRTTKRDRRRADDKYARPISKEEFKSIIGAMQNPLPTEDYMVISGKHTYQTQRGAIMKKLYDIGLINPDDASNSVAKPGLINLIPNRLAGRVDESRRNITIR